MPPSSEPDEKKLWELDTLAREALDETAMNERVYQATADALGRIAREHYPTMGHWHAEQMRELADRISVHAGRFTEDLCHLNSAGHREP